MPVMPVVVVTDSPPTFCPSWCAHQLTVVPLTVVNGARLEVETSWPTPPGHLGGRRVREHLPLPGTVRATY
jgi:hypothetical protein